MSAAMSSFSRFYINNSALSENRSDLEKALCAQNTHEVEVFLEKGALPSDRLDTGAMGLFGQKASVFSLLIFGQHWELAKNCIQSFTFDQDTLDEALLACAISANIHIPRESRIKQAHLALDLIALGANPDRMFEFHHKILEMVHTWCTDPLDDTPESGKVSARHWAIAGSLLLNQDGVRAMEQAFMVNLPAFNLPASKRAGGEICAHERTWAQWSMNLTRDCSDSDEYRYSSEVITRLLDNQPHSHEVILDLTRRALNESSRDGWRAFDGISNSKSYQNVSGSLSKEEFLSMLNIQRNNSVVELRRAKDLWLHPRLEKLVQLLPPLEQTSWHASFENWLRVVRYEAPKGGSKFLSGLGRSQMEKDVIDLALKSSMQAFENGNIAPNRRHRI